jgi:hypothetical protein
MYTIQGVAMVLVFLLGFITNNLSFQWLKEVCKGAAGWGIYYHYGYHRISCEEGETTPDQEMALFPGKTFRTVYHAFYDTAAFLRLSPHY